MTIKFVNCKRRKIDYEKLSSNSLDGFSFSKIFYFTLESIDVKINREYVMKILHLCTSFFVHNGIMLTYNA